MQGYDLTTNTSVEGSDKKIFFNAATKHHQKSTTTSASNQGIARQASRDGRE
jgi:hypothetical protein